MPSIREAQLRHAEHYATLAKDADNLYMQGGVAAMQGLSLFDQERAQIDAGWLWVQEQAGVADDADQLLRSYAAATALIGARRYDPRTQRIPQLRVVLEAVRRQNDRNAEGVTLGNLGNAYHSLGDARTALDFYEKQLAIAVESGDHTGEGKALSGIGLAHYTLGDLPEALQLHQQRLALAQKLDDPRGQAAALGNIGLVYVGLGQLRSAVHCYEQQLALAREMADQQGEGQALGNLGVAHRKLGDMAQATTYYKQHLALALSRDDRRGAATTSWNLGLLLVAYGNLAHALPLLEACVAYEEEIGHLDAAKDAEFVDNIRQRLLDVGSS